jgi:hypothetical protein
MYLVHSVIGIIRLKESFWAWPKMIPLSGVYCIMNSLVYSKVNFYAKSILRNEPKKWRKFSKFFKLFLSNSIKFCWIEYHHWHKNLFVGSDLLAHTLEWNFNFSTENGNQGFKKTVFRESGGELLELRLLDSQLLDTFGRKTTARHIFWQLLESSLSRINWIRAVDKKSARATYKLKKSIFFL